MSSRVRKIWLFAQVASGRVEARSEQGGDWRPVSLREQPAALTFGAIRLSVADFGPGASAYLAGNRSVRFNASSGERFELRARDRSDCS